MDVITHIVTHLISSCPQHFLYKRTKPTAWAAGFGNWDVAPMGSGALKILKRSDFHCIFILTYYAENCNTFGTSGSKYDASGYFNNPYQSFGKPMCLISIYSLYSSIRDNKSVKTDIHVSGEGYKTFKT